MAKFKFKKTNLSKIAGRWYRELHPNLLRAIKQDIVIGISPVFKGKYKGTYSKSYRKSIRNARKNNKKAKKIGSRTKRSERELARKQTGVVNLLLSGKLLRSSVMRRIKWGFKIEFKDPKAEWHHNGDGNLPVRRLLPTDATERFNSRISKIINDALKRAWNKRN